MNKEKIKKLYREKLDTKVERHLDRKMMAKITALGKKEEKGFFWKLFDFKVAMSALVVVLSVLLYSQNSSLRPQLAHQEELRQDALEMMETSFEVDEAIFEINTLAYEDFAQNALIEEEY